MSALPESVAASGCFDAVRTLVARDMARVDALIRRRLASEVLLINQVADHIIAGGGKRLRPMLVLLAAHAAGYRGDDHVQAAAIIEFIHTATLLHDDVVDESDLRRGRSTANAVWGNAASVLVGDFLYSRAFQMMVELDRMRIMQVLADTTNRIAEGEVLQLMHVMNPDIDEAAYTAVIERKTAVLFAAAGRVGAILAGREARCEEALATYGHELGMAFQIADDLLDYTADAATLGKNIGDDLAEGKATLPVIHALRNASGERAERVRRAVADANAEALPDVLAAIVDAGSIDYARAEAQRHAAAAERALAVLEPGVYHDALATLARYAVGRDH